MFNYIEYARIALADISGLNANVFYELGVRHRARPSGTAILRLTSTPIPFDIKQIKAFAYDYEPVTQRKESRAIITRLLKESLEQNTLDSPVQQALHAQEHYEQKVQGYLREATDHIRQHRLNDAINCLRQAVEAHPENALLRVKLGVILKDEGRLPEALEEFAAAAATAKYAPAQRELGVVQNLIYRKTKDTQLPDGSAALQKAIAIDPTDFDALAVLGGIRKREGKLDEAARLYRQSSDVSNGHPYPLLNALKLEAATSGKLWIDDARKRQLRRAERMLRGNVTSNPPIDPPWSFFDYAETRLYLGAPKEEFLQLVEDGLTTVKLQSWQAQTFADSLALLSRTADTLPGLTDAIARARDEAAALEAEERDKAEQQRANAAHGG
jgi:Flp pilus assembly protein TadD